MLLRDVDRSYPEASADQRIQNSDDRTPYIHHGPRGVEYLSSTRPIPPGRPSAANDVGAFGRVHRLPMRSSHGNPGYSAPGGHDSPLTSGPRRGGDLESGYAWMGS